MASEQLEATIATLRDLVIVSGDIDADRVAMGGSGIPDEIDHEMVSIAGCDAAWITTGSRRDAAMLYLHGGGYVLGGIHSHGPFAAQLSAETDLPVLVLDYRLGPEHVHPAALDDALAAFDWLVEQEIDPGRILVAGDSAGGGLTLATLAALRDRGVRPAAGIALSPWADLTCSSESHNRFADLDPLVSTEPLKIYAAAYAGETALDDPMLSPGLGDLSGLPPVLVQVGGIEVLLDDSTNVAAAIESVGGEVTFQRWDEAIHVFQMLGAPESDEAIAEIAAFARRHV
jgi:acetyl esterase/lipase